MGVPGATWGVVGTQTSSVCVQAGGCVVGACVSAHVNVGAHLEAEGWDHVGQDMQVQEEVGNGMGQR